MKFRYNGKQSHGFCIMVSTTGWSRVRRVRNNGARPVRGESGESGITISTTGWREVRSVRYNGQDERLEESQ